MFKGFMLDESFLELIPNEKREHYESLGKNELEKIKGNIRKNLDEFLLPKKEIDATKLQEEWFPEVEADIFLSHSHQDRDKALILAGYLYERFNIKVFVDSCIWGYSDELLELINETYNVEKKDGSTTTYNHKKATWSASNVHLMLSTALNKMIDKTECIFFLNTPNSVGTKDVENEERTKSPWIFSEIAFTKFVRRKVPKRTKELFVESAGETIKKDAEGIGFSYKLFTDNLDLLNIDIFKKWVEKKDIYLEILEVMNTSALNTSESEQALDKLYKLTLNLGKADCKSVNIEKERNEEIIMDLWV